MKSVQIIAYAPLHSPEVTSVPPTLETMQNIVGGLVEIINVRLDDQTFQVFVNEDAEARGLPLNRTVDGRKLFGIFVVTKFVGGVFSSIQAKEVSRVRRHLEAK